MTSHSPDNAANANAPEPMPSAAQDSPLEAAAAINPDIATAPPSAGNSAPTPAPAITPAEAPTVAKKPALPSVQPVLEKLFELYPQLFGAQFLPLKLGIFQELLAKHPDDFQRDTLKAALGVHTRSTRYLQSVAAAKARHDLQGQPGDAVASEHVYLAIMELHRRRQNRASEDLTPQLRNQLKAALLASGLSSQDYLARLLVAPEDAHPALKEVLDEQAQQVARQEALFKAFEASGKTSEEFADMYGMKVRDVNQAIERHQNLLAATSIPPA